MRTSFALTVYFDLYIFKDVCENLSFKTPTNITESATKLLCMTLKMYEQEQKSSILHTKLLSAFLSFQEASFHK